MENPIEVSDELRNQDLLNLIQVKQEADEEPHIIYDDGEQWAFLFSDAINGMKPALSGKQDGVCEYHIESIKTELDGVCEEQSQDVKIEPEGHTCHWCSFITTDPLDLIDHDYENHSKFFQGKRIHKSYRCPSCEYTSIDPSNIRNHFTEHRNWPDAAICNSNDIATTNMQRKKKKKRKQSWRTQLKKKREQKILKKSGDQKNNDVLSKKRSKMSDEERRLKKILQTRKYRASLSAEALAKRRLNDAARMRLKRALESSEVKAERRRKQALHARQKRASETPEEVEMRRSKQRNRARVRRSQETTEQREVRKERERLRARERRASLSSQKRELIKEVERTRKRFLRHQAKSVDENFMMHATQFLTTSLSASESSFQQSSNTLDTKPQNNSVEEITKFYPVSMHMLDSSPIGSTLPKSKQSNVEKRTNQKCNNGKYRSKNKKRGRAKIIKNKPNNLEHVTIKEDVHESSTTEPSAIDIQKALVHEHITTNVNKKISPENEEFNLKNVGNFSCQINSSLDISNDFTYNEAIKRKFIESNENIDDNKSCSVGSQNDQEKSFDLNSSYLFTQSTTTKINEQLIPSNEAQGNYDLLNNISHNHLTKMDKLNKLLHRMCEKDSK